MGVYIYSMRKPLIKAQYGNETVEIAPMRFLVKPHTSLGKLDSLAARLTAACEARFSNPLPKLVVVCHEKPKTGDEVMVYKSERPWCYDTPGLPGYTIGKLLVEGKRYSVEKLQETSMSFYYVENGMQFRLPEHHIRYFNERVIDGFTPEKYQKGVTSYTSEDWFTMDNGFFRDTQGKEYRNVDMVYPEWYVKVRLSL